jgi:hypothetical protein
VRGRTFEQKDLVVIRAILRAHPSTGRTAISKLVCAALDWLQEDGRAKERACRVALLRLEKQGFLSLPRRLVDRGGRPPVVDPLELLPPPRPMTFMPKVVRCELVRSKAEGRLWNSLIAHHHYMGLATPVGRLVRYIVYGDDQLLGAISFSECAWALHARSAILRDLGLSTADTRNLVINNNRFLLLPWIKVPNLASRVLSEASRSVARDWAARYCSMPVLVESFVDQRRFVGTCYRAASWTKIGSTRGFAKHGSHHVRHGHAKSIWVYGLNPFIQRKLGIIRSRKVENAA